MNKLLFITWDGPQTSYMEGLFMPIFQEIKNLNPNWEFHVMQFTWGDENRVSITQEKANELGIIYTSLPICRKPIASLGAYWTLYRGSAKIKKYIEENAIQVVMPRSTFPAHMVNKLKNENVKIIFDADGLPIEERIDFSGLNRNSKTYQFLKNIETQMLKKADAVITRSKKAIVVHVQTIGEVHRPKFSVVLNGRNPETFRFDEDTRKKIRKELNVEEEKLFVYAGSLGPQYCLPEMLAIFENYSKFKKSKFLILTGNLDFAKENIPAHLLPTILLKTVKSDEVSQYLNAADLAFGLRKPSFSMQGVAPIKLGEYLLCGLPIIASKGIGDTEEILENFENSFLFDHNEDLNSSFEKMKTFLENSSFAERNKISQKALNYFSLNAAAKSYLNVLDT